jgi:hypothetical protein
MEGQRRDWFRLVVAVVLVGMLAAGASGILAAENRITLDFKDSPIEGALQALFQGTGRNYAINPGVRGTVTLSLRDMPFDQAMQAIVRSAGLTYKVEDNVYMVRQKETTTPGTPSIKPSATSAAGASGIELPSAEVRIEKIPMNFADAVDIAGMFGSESMLSRGGTLAMGGTYGIGSGISGGGYSGYGGGGGYGGYGGYGGTGGYGGYGGSSMFGGGYGGTGGFGGYGGGYSSYGGGYGYGSYGR